MVNMVKLQVKRNFVKKGLVAKRREVDTPKMMATVKHNVSHLNSKRSTIMLSMQSDQNGHWSHLSGLPSQGALIGSTTICDTCYLSDC